MDATVEIGYWHGSRSFRPRWFQKLKLRLLCSPVLWVLFSDWLLYRMKADLFWTRMRLRHRA